MEKLYEFFDKRNEEYLKARKLDDAIFEIFGTGSIRHTIMGWEDAKKIEKIVDSGFIVSDLPHIDTLMHSCGNKGGECGPEKVQVDFNEGDDTIQLDIWVETINGKKYINIDFLDNYKDKTCFNRIYDHLGNEKCFEECSSCGEEVLLDVIKKQKQVCPSCGDKIIACCLCTEEEMDCANCSANDNNKVGE